MNKTQEELQEQADFVRDSMREDGIVDKTQKSKEENCKHKDLKNVVVKEAVICKHCNKIIGHMTKTVGEGVTSK